MDLGVKSVKFPNKTRRIRTSPYVGCESSDPEGRAEHESNVSPRHASAAKARTHVECEGEVAHSGASDAPRVGHGAGMRGGTTWPIPSQACEASRILCPNLLKFITFAYELHF